MQRVEVARKKVKARIESGHSTRNSTKMVLFRQRKAPATE
jgi:hypothetical protein